MASITSLSNSSYSTSSIYGNRNVLSGLASGMDTESMIENAVSGIKLKIQTLQQKRTKIEWQQEAYRSIIDKAVNFNNNYTSYTSKTNLLSNSFFTNAVNTTALGTYADKVTASGKSSSDIKINSVKQLATAASYTVSGLGGMNSGAINSILGGEAFDITGTTPVSTISGSLTFQYGGTNGTTFDIKFDELENIMEEQEGSTTAEKLANAIQQKLSEVTYNYTKNGFQETTTADKAIKVSVENGEIKFSDGLNEGNNVSISSVSGDIEGTLGIQKGDTSIKVTYDTQLVKDTPTADYLSDKELSVSLNGTTKKINMGDVIKNANLSGNTMAADVDNALFRASLQSELDNAFGKGRVTVSEGGDAPLSFTTNGEGDTLTIGGSAVEVMGFESGDSNYINTGKKLSDLLGDNASEIFTDANRLKGEGSVTEKTSPNGSTYYVDEKGNRVDKDGFRIDSDGKALYDFEVNGAHINVTEDTTLESLINSVNSNAEAGMKISYSKLTNEFKFTSTETGANSKVELGGLAAALFANHTRTADDPFEETYGFEATNDLEFKVDGAGIFSVEGAFNKNSTVQDVVDTLNSALENEGMTASFDKLSGQIKIIDDKTGKTVDFKMGTEQNGSFREKNLPDFGSSYTNGQDAIMDVEINGVRFENLTRASNNFDLDGMSITVKDTFNEDGSGVDKDGNEIEPVTFKTTTDSDKIVEAIASFINDYNELATEIKNAYSTMPAQQSNGSRYEPLTAEDEEGMTESAISAYEEKAKQGILFGDTDLSSFYSKLLGAITPGGEDGQILREIGIKTSYSDGMTTLTLDEEALRNALDSDPDKVRSAFTKTKEGGSSSDGLMQTMQNTLNTYVKTTGEPKGVLITHAGSVKAPTSLNSNSLKSQMDSIDSQIERWQDKMSDQIDRYTTKFSKLEQLIAEMNSQSSALMGLMGGSTGY